MGPPAFLKVVRVRGWQPCRWGAVSALRALLRVVMAACWRRGADVGVDGGGDADVGVPEELLDHDEFHTLLQEERRSGMAKIVEPDTAEARAVEEGGEGAGKVGGVDGAAGGRGEHVAALLPPVPGSRPFLFLPPSMGL
ncbi:hypothetical protein GCM10020256_74380 [Streptomyces thermocoprophilus]